MSTVVCQCVPLLSPSPTRRGEILFSWAGRLHGGILLALIVKIEVWTISNKLITAQCTFCVQWLHTFMSNCSLSFREHFLGLDLWKCMNSQMYRIKLYCSYWGVIWCSLRSLERYFHHNYLFAMKNWRFLKNLPLAVELLPQQIGLCLKCSNVGGKGSNIVNRTSIFSQSSV